MIEHACPRCHYILVLDGMLCTHCGWVMPSPWRLLALLDEARNHVMDADLRAEIAQVVPPRSRDWPEFLPWLEMP